MIQLLARFIVPKEDLDEEVEALRTVLWGVQQARACRFAQISFPAEDDGRIEYVEEWDNELELCAQFESERFVRLLGLFEVATKPPVIEFRVISETYGLEYITSRRAALAEKAK
jgi:hypothetical protein